MAKKKSWFTLVKRFFFISDSHSNQDKEKRKKWVFARLRMKRLASLTAPTPQPQPQEIEDRSKIAAETEEKHSNRELTVAIAEETEKPLIVEAREENDVRSEIEDGEMDILESSAVKIQIAFRGYLARKALRALKGIVTLQAIIRGRAVRRQAATTLKRLQSIINIQSQVCANRQQPTEAASDEADNNQLASFRAKMLRMESCNVRRWDDSLMSKEEADASFLSKKEAAIKRERIKEYWHHHRKSAETERKQVSGRWRYWLEQWVDTQLTKSKELEDLDTKQRYEFGSVKKPLGLRNLQARSEALFFADSRTKQPHNHHRRQCSLGAVDHESSSSFAGSPAPPAYMAATESARAKARSASSPKLRPLESAAEAGFSPSNKNKLSLVSSVASELPMGFQQRSPSLKGVRGPVKSTRNMVKDLTFDSEWSLSHWNQQQKTTTFR